MRNTSSNAYIYADSNGHDGSHGNGNCDCGAEVYADAQAASHARPTPISSAFSWLDSGTREQKLASSCFFMERGNIHVARIVQAMSFPGRPPKDQSRAKRFDKSPRFTLKTVSVSRSQSANSNHRQSQ